ncbi:hypothetical protein NLI96_g6202 [Meripilus lineatus]|uniref:Uncharacterized protein n=1 Tax=Meripilus lineatus TaxID=2056292 RepID=A0AAD5V223_9APHY|nr:hypothetical protein NLI96_g6202 [Physisporinus lineatus]
MLGNIPKPLSLMPSDLRTDEGEFYELPLRSPAVPKAPTLQAMPPRGITRLTVDIPSSRSSKPLVTHPPRWGTPEFLFYGLIFCVVVPIMVWVPVQLSSPSNPNYAFYEPRLRPGWIFGRKVDNSDAQYRSFRDNIPVLTVLIGLSVALKSLYTHVTKLGASGPRRDNLYLIPFLVTFSVLFLLGLHGTSIIKVFIIISINYSIAKYLGPSKLSPVLTWVFNGAILFANETYSGYKFASIHPSLGLLWTHTTPG